MELTDEQQIERQDFVDNRIFALLNELSPNGKSLDWNIEAIGRVRDAVAQVFKENLLFCEQDFYPYINM